MQTLLSLLKDFKNSYPEDIYLSKAPAISASFIIPVFNSEDSIANTIMSISFQTCIANIKQVVIINDGSTDNAKAILEALKNKYKGILNIIVLNNKIRKYSAYSRNKGLKYSTGDVICFIDSDIMLPENYLENHLSVHEKIQDCITFSLRTDTEISEYRNLSFPIDQHINEFREGLLDSNNRLQGSTFDLNEKYTLADLCLTCAVSYKRSDLMHVKGCPNNFVGWGFNDTTIAAKVISLKRFVIPISCSVYHKKHAPRSGNTNLKEIEYMKNKQRYETLLNMPVNETFHYNITALNF